MKYESVNQYFEMANEIGLSHLNKIRDLLKEIIPNSIEVISYNMPAFKTSEVVVYYAAGKTHLGFYPTPLPIETLQAKLSGLKYSKGAVQFPYNKELPIDLIKELTEIRLKQIENKS